MKNGKRPTVAQKKFLAQWKLNPDDWLVCKNTDSKMVVVSRYTGAVKSLPKI